MWPAGSNRSILPRVAGVELRKAGGRCFSLQRWGWWAAVLLGALAGELGAAGFAGEDGWEIYTGQFESGEYADGDSFQIRAQREGSEKGGRNYVYIFRLYGVDAPESDSRYKDRNNEQARYFGVPAYRVEHWGKRAAEFTQEILGKARSIRVATRKEQARGASDKNRYFAFVEVDGKDLGLILLEKGLARSYGVAPGRPFDRKGADDWRRAWDRAERSARSAGAGIWAE